MSALNSTRRAIVIASCVATTFFAPPSFAQHHGGHTGHGGSGHYGLGGHSGLGGQHTYSGHYGGSHGYGTHGGLQAYALHDYGNYGYGHDIGGRYDIGRHYDGLSHHYSPSYSYPQWKSQSWYGCYSTGRGENQVIVNRPLVNACATSPSTASSEYVEQSTTDSSQGLNYRRRAEAAFREGRYKEAVRLANHALVEEPRNGKLMLVKSHSLFAIGDYRAAAEAIHRAASVLGKRDWGHVVKNFRDYYRGRQYAAQLEQLNNYIKTNPEAAYARFLRGYHFGYLGHHEFARQELAKTLDLESRDQLAADLLAVFGDHSPATSPKHISDEPLEGASTVGDTNDGKASSNAVLSEGLQGAGSSNGHAADDHHH